MNHNIKHLAIIMDGNARWAEKHGLSKAEGHRKGAEAAKSIIRAAIEYKIPYVTLYAFSFENWQRPVEEVNILLKLLSYYVKNETKLLHENDVRLKVVGNLAPLNDNLKKQIQKATETTSNNKTMTVSIAFSYSSREEIVAACQKVLDSGVKVISEEVLKNNMYDPEMPEVDLLIRTSGEYRISNFLLWQAAYAELYFSEKYWPEFCRDDLDEAINDFAQRIRRFGSR